MVRIIPILAVLAVIGIPLLSPAIVQATADVSLWRSPNPPCYLLNNGATPESFWWKITFDTTPDYATLEIFDPDGFLVHNDTFDLSGKTSPVYNFLQSVGDPGMGDPAYAYNWSLGAGAKAGEYEARLYFSSEEVENESAALQTFWVRQRVQVYKYNDLDGDGTDNGGTEPPLSGWNFTVSCPPPHVSPPRPLLGNPGDAGGDFWGVTNSSGYAVFQSGDPTAPPQCLVGPQLFVDVLNSGGYNVTETLKSGWTNTDPGGSAITPLTKNFSVPDPAGATIVVKFGNQGLGNLTIFKYHDKDYSHTYNAGDEPLENWDFTVAGLSGTYTTDASGLVTIHDIPAGDYVVTEVTPLPTGWVNTDPGDGTYQKTATVPAGGSDQVDFGNKPLAELIIFKYHDEDYSGTYNTGDSPLAGWEFDITPTPPAVSGNPTPPYLTDASGKITLTVNADTEYTITEANPLPSGWVNTDPGDGTYRKTATVSPDGSVQVDFGNKPLAELIIFKYHDKDYSGTYNTGDSALAGWEFTVSPTPPAVSGNPTPPYLTDASGKITLTVNADTLYTITEETPLPTGWVNTDPGDGTYRKTATVAPGGSEQVDFGNKPLAELIIFKYHDEDYSGTYNTGDSALAGWEFTVTPTPPAVPGNPTAPYLTDANGKITFQVNADTLYTITEETPLPTGWVNTDPGDGTYRKTATVAPGGSELVDFGNKPMAELIIFKYHDEDYSGTYNTGDSALAGWEFTVSPTPPAVPGNPTAPYLTDANGKITFEVDADTLYTITEETPLPTGWVNTDPGDGTYRKTATVSPGGSVQVDFGNKPLGELIIFKYHDEDYSGTYNTGDSALAAWEFTVSPTPPAVTGNPTPPYLTDASGKITLTVNADTVYTITEVHPLPSGWVNTDPGDGTYRKTATVSPDGSVQVDFGNKPLAELVIFKYRDADNSASYNAGDTPLANWEFTVSPTPPAVTGNPTAPYHTGADGKIRLQVNADILYTITETLKAGWVCTDPGDPAPYDKQQSVPVGESRQVNFGNSAPPTCLIICKYQDSNVNGMWDTGEPWLPDWRFRVTGYGYDEWVTTGDDGCVQVDLPVAGKYTVTEELKAGWYNTEPGGDPPYRQKVTVTTGTGCARVEFGNREEIKDIPVTVPAMNEWGIIAMITMFAGLLVWTVRRKRLAL